MLQVEVIYMGGDNQRAAALLEELPAKTGGAEWIQADARLLQAEIKSHY